jgi:hypothetical protein
MPAPGPRTTADSLPLPCCAGRVPELPANVLELLRPGSFVRLRNQPADLPPFQLILCRGGRCLLRLDCGAQGQGELAGARVVLHPRATPPERDRAPQP